MKKVLITSMAAASLFTMQLAHSATICDAKSALKDARSHLVSMVGSTDKAEQKSLKTKVDAATTELEAAIKAMLGDANKGDDAQLTTFQETWAAFKNTRETEIVPAVYAGDSAKAKAIATGIQAERMSVMNGVVSTLGGDKCK
ncbi:MAG: hypothetical protein GY807_10305 [Gammaproteobacteria bacterium]|nr:hypothetical protein [Gammaproteobacteria bacterium]